MKIRKASLNDAKGIAKVLVESYNIKDLKEGITTFKNETRKFHNYIVLYFCQFVNDDKYSFLYR